MSACGSMHPQHYQGVIAKCERRWFHFGPHSGPSLYTEGATYTWPYLLLRLWYRREELQHWLWSHLPLAWRGRPFR